MSQTKKETRSNDTNFLESIMFRFYPYWPMFVFFGVICFVSAFAYMYVAKPTYDATAVLLIKDEKKGYDDSRVMESLNFFGSKKIVENEIEVIHSRAIMQKVVKSLALYAPVSREGRIRSTSAYSTTPINIEARYPEKIIEKNKIYFIYNDKNKYVKMGKTAFPINEWVKTEYGELRFTINKKAKKTGVDPLYFSLIPLKTIVSSLLKSLNVTATNKLSSVVNLQFVDEVPERAEDILNEIINAYNKAGIDDKSALAGNTLKFVDDRLKHVQFDLDSVERQIQLYRADRGAVNLSEQSSLFLKNVGENDQRVALLNMQINVLDNVQKYINSGQTKGSIAPSTLGVNDPVLTQLFQRLYDAESEYEKLKNTTAENNPMLISLRNEIQRLRPNILENIRIERINLESSRNQLNATNKTYSQTLQSIPEKERRLLEISRQQTIINSVYNFLLQKREETALSYASTVPDSRVLDYAESSFKPVSPKKAIVFPVALIMSLLLTIAFISFKDFATGKILFRSEIESLTDIPVIGEIAYVKPEHRAIKKDYINQQFSQIIASIGLFQKSTSQRKILVTSGMPGEGKSFISINFALTLARAGKKVVLVDIDMKNPTISGWFSLKGPGVTEFLLGEKEGFDIINSSKYTNLYIIGAGETLSNSTALLSNNRLDNLFNLLEQSFDFIVIDTAPIDPITDALILSQYSDLTLYVIRHAFTPKALIQMLYQKNILKNFKNISIVFNSIKSRGWVSGHRYGYGYDFPYKKNLYRAAQITSKEELLKKV